MTPDTTYSKVLGSISNFWRKHSPFSIRPGRDTVMQDEPRINSQAMNKKQIATIKSVIEYNYARMEYIRKGDKEMRVQYLGHMATPNGGGGTHSTDSVSVHKAVVINKIQDAVRIWLQNMASGNPRLGVETEYPQLRSFAWQFGHAINQHLDEIEIGEDFAVGAFDGFFGPTVYKTALGAGCPDLVQCDGALIDPGSAFTRAIELQHMVLDMAARNAREVDLIGDRYLRPKKWVEEQLKRARNGEPFAGYQDQRELELRAEERATGHDMAGEHRLYDQVYVWDLYLPKENLIVSIPEGHDEAMHVYPWDGPIGGPYRLHSYFPACDAPFGPPAAAAIFELHMFANEAMRKICREANNFKNVLLYELGAEAAAEAVRDADDQSVVGVPPNTLDKLKDMKFAGADPMLSRMLVWVLQTADTEAGNLQALGGLGPSAETYRGDKMITQNASGFIRWLQMKLYGTLRPILAQHAWWIWTEDIRGYSGYAEIPNSGIYVPWAFTPAERRGKFLSYNFKLQPYSLQSRSPDEEAEVAMQLWGAAILPNAELLLQTGQMPNAAEFVRYLCKQYNLPLDVFLKPMDPQMQAQFTKAMMDAPPRLKQSHTVNERVSRPGTSPHGQDNEFLRGLDKVAGQQAATTPGQGG